MLKPLAAPETDSRCSHRRPACASTADHSRYVNETIPDIEATVETFKAKGRAVYGITLGDIVFDTPDLWSNMKEAMGNRNLTIFQTIGNHDHLKTETSDDKAAANFESQFGPRNYSFNRGNATSSRWTTSSTSAAAPRRATTRAASPTSSSNGSVRTCRTWRRTSW